MQYDKYFVVLFFHMSSFCFFFFFFLPFRLRSRGFEVAQMEDRRIRDGKVVDSIPDRGDGRIIFCRSKYTQNVKAKEKKK